MRKSIKSPDASQRTFAETPMLLFVLAIILGYTLAYSFNFRSKLDFLLIIISFAFAFVNLLIKESKILKKIIILALSIPIFSAYFYWKVDENPEPNSAPFQAKILVEVCDVSTNLRKDKFGVAKILKCPQENLIGTKIWYSISPDKNGIHQVPAFERGSILELFGTLNPSHNAWLASRGFYPKNLEHKRNETRFDNYLNTKGIFHKISLQESEMRVLKQAPFPYSFYTYLNNAIKEKLSVFAFKWQENTDASSALIAMLLGDKSKLSTTLKNAFKESGTMHVFAISGLHIGFAAALIFLILSRFNINWKLQGVLALPLLFLYVEICGAKASAMRAFIMIFAVWIGYMLKRTSGAYQAILLAMTISLLVFPENIFDAGWVMSYAITMSIIVSGTQMFESIKQWRFSRFVKYGKQNPVLQSIRDYLFNFFVGGLTISFAAFMVATPLTAYYFGYISPLSIILSPFYVMAAGIGVSLGLLSAIFPIFISKWINSLVWFDLSAMCESVKFLYENYHLAIPFEIENGYLAGLSVGIYLLTSIIPIRINTLFRFAIPIISTIIILLLAKIW